MTIFYNFDGKTYINLTNECPCDCVFCIRKNSDGITGSDSLWLEHKPDFYEVMEAFKKFDTQGATEAVFCGYGEPTVEIELLLETAVFLKANTNMKIRLNTNGLLRMIHPDFDINRLKGLIDSVSISLNAPDSNSYNEITRPNYKGDILGEVLNFSRYIKGIVHEVVFTVVDIISAEKINECKKIANDLAIPLKVRHYITNNENYQ